MRAREAQLAKGGERKEWELATEFSELREASRGGGGGRTTVTHWL